MRLLVIAAVFLILPNMLAAQTTLSLWQAVDGQKVRGKLLKINEKAETITLLVPQSLSFDQLSPKSLQLARTLSPLERRELHPWVSAGGHEAQGILFGVDEETETVTILLPRNVAFDRLAPESLRLARNLALLKSTEERDVGRARSSNGERVAKSDSLDASYRFARPAAVGATSFQYYVYVHNLLESDGDTHPEPHNQKYTIGVIPHRERVRIIGRKRFDKIRKWIYLVQYRQWQLWVVEDFLSKDPDAPPLR